MPWDTHLNQDVHSSHDFHVSTTSHLPEEHPSKFSGSTPKRMAYSYKRILHPTEGVSPTNGRIIQDIRRIIQSLKLVFEAKGTLVNENIKGRRYVTKDGNERKNWGGVRKKKEVTYRDIRLHKDAADETKRMVGESIAKLGNAMITQPSVEPLADGIDVDESELENAIINNEADL